MEIANNKEGEYLYIVYTVGVPGLGKSSLVNKLRDYCETIGGVSVEVCVSDEVRSKVLAQEYSRRSLDMDNLTQDDVFRVEVDSGPKIKEEYNRFIANRLQVLKSEDSMIKILIIDKNYSTQSLISFVSGQAELIFPNTPISTAVLLPKNFESLDDSKLGPFRFPTLMIALMRSLGRQGHLTMKYGPVHSMLSYITCLQSHCSDEFDQKFPLQTVKRVPVRYYELEKASAFHLDHSNKEAIQRLRNTLVDLVDKKAEIKDHVENVLKDVQTIMPMNAFVTYDELELRGILKGIIQ